MQIRPAHLAPTTPYMSSNFTSSRTAPSPAPTFRGALHALGAQLTRTESEEWDRYGYQQGSNHVVVSVSSSRKKKDMNVVPWAKVAVNLRGLVGRNVPDHIVSYGRGGAGNIHRAKLSHSPLPTSSAEPPHGREVGSVGRVGRGGAGNIRHPSKHRQATVDPSDLMYEHHVIMYSKKSSRFHSSGIGGAGNIKVSPDPSRTRKHSAVKWSLSRDKASRGGYGNFAIGSIQEEPTDELEMHTLSSSLSGGSYSTGRGGLTSVTSLPCLSIERIREVQEEDPIARGEVICIGRVETNSTSERSEEKGSLLRTVSRPRTISGVGESRQGTIGKFLSRMKKREVKVG